jgi:hypothetical protein
MYGRLRIFWLCASFLLLTAFAAAFEQPDTMRPLGAPGRYTFFPNQLAANEWYKPAGRLVNGHIAESFGSERNWPELRRFLHETKGAFGVNAAEVGYLNSEWLLGLRRGGIRVSAEASAWTQCVEGKNLARTELFGRTEGERNAFESVFHIHTTNGRSDPLGHGWFFTKDERDYAPDEIVLDHRIDFLIPHFDFDALLAAHAGQSWQSIKDAARRDPCPAADKFHNPPVDRLTGAVLDYIDYANLIAQKFPDKPAFSFHWGVDPHWEWADERCLDALHDGHPDPASFVNALRRLERPCHRDTEILDRLVRSLCQAGVCPSTVFMDIDLHYNTAYALDVLRRNRDVLNKHGIAFGVDLVDECNEQTSCIQAEVAPGEMRLSHRAASDAQSENMLDQESLINKFKFLVANDIIDDKTHVNFESWNVRPAEMGDETAESKKGSFANTVLKLVREITQRGWTRAAR